jgi:hypothetical protein
MALSPSLAISLSKASPLLGPGFISIDTITFNWGEKPSPWGTTEGPGYPSAITFHENRLWFGGSPGYPQKIWVSSENDYIDMNPGPNSGDAFGSIDKGFIRLEPYDV